MKRKTRDEKIAHILYLLIGAACGAIILLSADPISFFGSKPSHLLISLGFSMLFVFAAYFVQLIIHELGHLVFGILSGYEFISFRIGGVMLIKETGKLRIKIYKIVGTGGQCLMMPPPWKKDLPMVLYNLGGCIFNLVFGILFLAAFVFMEKGGYFSMLIGLISVWGFGNLFLNGIPLKVGGICNDGKNAILIKKSEKARHILWLQLYVNGLMAKGEKISNMPENWFFLPEGEDLFDPMICTIGVMRFNYFFEKKEFEKAEEIAEYMIKAPGILGLHKNELLCELLFIKIYLGAESSVIEKIYTKELDKYIKATANYISRRRLAYAYQLLYKRNIYMAEKCLAVFERTAKIAPYSAEIENEREIIKLIQSKSEDIFSIQCP